MRGVRVPTAAAVTVTTVAVTSTAAAAGDKRLPATLAYSAAAAGQTQKAASQQTPCVRQGRRLPLLLLPRLLSLLLLLLPRVHNILTLLGAAAAATAAEGSPDTC
jgi:hypothetical protein